MKPPRRFKQCCLFCARAARKDRSGSLIVAFLDGVTKWVPWADAHLICNKGPAPYYPLFIDGEKCIHYKPVSVNRAKQAFEAFAKDHPAQAQLLY